MTVREGLSICVVGAGPRGTVLLERLCANIPELAPDVPVDVHIVDPHPPGAGRVWATDQSRLLLMNTVASDVTVFTDPTVVCEGPIRPGPTQYEWACQVSRGEVTGQQDWVVEEARTIRPWSYATRAFQGAYLGWAFEHLARHTPANLRLRLHRRRAERLVDLPDGRQLVCLDGGTPAIEADAVVVAQGHFDVTPTSGELRFARFAARHGLSYLPPASPAESDLRGVAAGRPVLLRGLGLNFYDYAALLTVGRGGRFVRADGKLRYLPSGREPVLHVGSGRGVPYRARAEIREAYVPRYQPTFFTAEQITRLRVDAGSGRTDFLRDVYPLVCKEVGWIYYRHLLRERGDAAGDDFARRYAGCDWDSAPMRALIEATFPDPETRWSWDRLDDPTGGRHFGPGEYDGWVLEQLRDDFRRSGLGPAGDAQKAVASIMRDLRDEVRQVISHRGISGESYRRHIDGWFSGLNNYIASGPPAARVGELIALAEAGVVRFVGPRMRVECDEDAGRFVASSPSVGDAPVRAAAFIEARLPANDVRRAEDNFVRGMVQAGQCRPHTIPNADGTGYETGGIDVMASSMRMLDAGGTAHPARFAYGPPIESVQWVTAIGARPHVNSRTLMQGDAIARGCLGAEGPHGVDASRGSELAGLG